MVPRQSPPGSFCWTRFGTESGEAIEDILARKERERIANAGVFLWGIGNSIGPAIRELVRAVQAPRVVFSPMRSKPKAIDVAPESLLTWTAATTLDGQEWAIPAGSRVVSRGSSEGNREKFTHYALVCRSSAPLARGGDMADIAYEELVNLLSGNKLGHSQVTAVVRRAGPVVSTPTLYPVSFSAELVYPYFVRLSCPTPESRANTRTQARLAQASLPVTA